MLAELAEKREEKAQAEAERDAAAPRTRARTAAENRIRTLTREITSLQTKVELVHETDPIEGDVGALADAALDALGMPRLASIARARADIVRHLQSRAPAAP